jgi:hypothetical protein
MGKICLECEVSFNGRTDKKCCSDLCRNSFNTKLKTATSEHFRNVNAILRKNYKILENHIPDETAKASKTKLLQKGI